MTARLCKQRQTFGKPLGPVSAEALQGERHKSTSNLSDDSGSDGCSCFTSGDGDRATRRIADKGIVEVGNGDTPPMSLDGGAKSVLLSTNQQLRHHSQLDRCEACSNNIVYCSNE